MTTHPPLRILHLLTSDAGGLSRYVLDLCQSMHNRGHKVAVAGQRGQWHDRFAAAPFPWIDLPLAGGPIALWQAAKSLRQYLADHPTDVLHTHYRRASLVARRAAHNGNPPILYTLHLSDIPLRGPRRLLTDFGDHTHAPSQGARHWLISDAKIPAERITTIPHGIATERFPQRDAAMKSAARAALGIGPADTLAIFVARLDYPKNADWMLALAAQARDALPHLKILLVGDGPEAAALRADAAGRHLTGQVQFLGEREVLPIYHAADALLLPSLREGFGLACAEAMCAGVPVLRTRTAGTEELIVENITGRSAPIDKNRFIAAALAFLSDPAALATMGTAAARHIRDNFTLERQVDQTIDLYRRLAASKRN